MRLFLFFEIANWNIGLLLYDVLNGFLADNWDIVIQHARLLKFLVFGNLIAEVSGFFKVFVTGCLSLEVFGLNQPLVNNLRINKVEGQIHLRASLVQEVDSLVWQEAILNVSVGEKGSCFNGRVCVLDMMVVFVFFLNPFEDGNRFFYCRLVYLNWLHAAFEGCILLDDTVFIEGGCSDHLEFSASQSWFEDISGVHITIASRPRSDNFMDLINKENDILTRTNLVHELLHPLFKLTTDTSSLY